jgi:hypothetical protein
LFLAINNLYGTYPSRAPELKRVLDKRALNRTLDKRALYGTLDKVGAELSTLKGHYRESRLIFHLPGINE